MPKVPRGGLAVPEERHFVLQQLKGGRDRWGCKWGMAGVKLIEKGFVRLEELMADGKEGRQGTKL